MLISSSLAGVYSLSLCTFGLLLREETRALGDTVQKPLSGVVWMKNVDANLSICCADGVCRRYSY